MLLLLHKLTIYALILTTLLKAPNTPFAQWRIPRCALHCNVIASRLRECVFCTVNMTGALVLLRLRKVEFTLTLFNIRKFFRIWYIYLCGWLEQDDSYSSPYDACTHTKNSPIFGCLASEFNLFLIEIVCGCHPPVALPHDQKYNSTKRPQPLVLLIT